MRCTKYKTRITILFLFMLLSLSMFAGCGQESEGKTEPDNTPAVETAKPKATKKAKKSSKKKKTKKKKQAAKKKKQPAKPTTSRKKRKFVDVEIGFRYKDPFSLKSFVGDITGQDGKDSERLVWLYLDGEKVYLTYPDFYIIYGQMLEGYHVLQAVRPNGDTVGMKFYVREVPEEEREILQDGTYVISFIYQYDRAKKKGTMEEYDKEPRGKEIYIEKWKKVWE